MNYPRQIRSAVFWALLLGICLTYFSPTRSNLRSLVLKEPSGYYGALTDAFLSGQVSMKAGPDPRLLKAENPYIQLLDVPRPHDMSLYKGKLYLYFGPAPAIMLFLPWRLITGSWLADQGGTKIFCIIGLVLGATLMRRIRKRYFDGCAEGLEVTMGSLFPPAGDPEWLGHPRSSAALLKRLVRVRLDDAVVLEGPLPTYDAGSDQLAFWENPIGASSCRDRFSGTVIESREPTW
jgi:hypothetical protein